MAFGERLRFFRNMKNMTQRGLGLAMGFPEKSADIRVVQYEKGLRHPKEDGIRRFAEVLDVSPKALNVPNIDDPEGLIYTLFALEDRYGLRVGNIGDVPFLHIDITENKDAAELYRLLGLWSDAFARLEAGEISKEEYDNLRYRFNAE